MEGGIEKVPPPVVQLAAEGVGKDECATQVIHLRCQAGEAAASRRLVDAENKEMSLGCRHLDAGKNGHARA